MVKGWSAWWAKEQEHFRQAGITDDELTAEKVAGAVEKVFGPAVQITEWSKPSGDADG